VTERPSHDSEPSGLAAETLGGSSVAESDRDTSQAVASRSSTRAIDAGPGCTGGAAAAQIICAPPRALPTLEGMRTSTTDPLRRRVVPKVCGLALAAALAHGATGCAHRQLTNSDVAIGVVAAAVIAGAMVIGGTHCNQLTSQCRSGESTTGPLPPPSPGFHAIPTR
jgi:hypothetical protein